MAKWFLLAAAMAIFGIGIYLFASGGSSMSGGGTMAVAFLFIAAAVAANRRAGNGS